MLYGPIEQLQPIERKIMIGPRVGRIGDAAPQVVDRGVSIRQCRVWIPLNAPPRRFRNRCGEQQMACGAHIVRTWAGLLSNSKNGD
jgi:hypothetical protein